MSAFKDAGHLFRFAGLFVLAFLVFLVVRHFVVPKSFGRVWALSRRGDRRDCRPSGEVCRSPDLRDLPHGHSGREEERQARARELRSLPRSVGESCGRSSVSDAGPKPDTAVLCARCHTASAAKPKGFPQVVPAEHSNGLPCETCHNPHSPAMDAQEVRSEYYPGVKC